MSSLVSSAATFSWTTGGLLVIVFDCFLESLKRAAEIAAETRDFLRAKKEYYDKQYYE